MVLLCTVGFLLSGGVRQKSSSMQLSVELSDPDSIVAPGANSSQIVRTIAIPKTIIANVTGEAIP